MIAGKTTRRIYIFFVVSLLVVSCHSPTSISYSPKIDKVKNPVATIQDTIDAQPKAQKYKPTAVEVTEKYIRLYMVESGGHGLGFVAGRIAAVPMSDKLKASTIYFKQIGDVKMLWDDPYDQYYLEIIDKDGDHFCCVFTYSRLEAERFMDAVFFMMVYNEIK